MRIVMDMQGAQSESRFRGIGRYSQSFAQGIVRNRGEHEVILALSGLLPEAIEPIRAAFDGLLPQDNIRVWQAPGPVLEKVAGNEGRRETAELIREAFLASLKPDIIHISSLFEGFVDDAVTSIGRFDRKTPVSVSLYDLIPLLNPDHYLKPDPLFAKYYQRKLGYLGQAAVNLSISEFTREEGLAHLNMPEDRIVNVSTAMEPCFQPLKIDDETRHHLNQKFGLTRPFILYTGGDDQRKNLPRLIAAFAGLPASLRAGHHLLLAGRMLPENIEVFQRAAKSSGLRPDDLCFTGYVTDQELVSLYNLCKLFVFPSWHEGFGLPALEAMACGAPTIGSDKTSIPEVIAWEDARFDPLDVAAIKAKMVSALEDDAFRAALRKHGLEKAKRFSWDLTAQKAIAAWELRHKSSLSKTPLARPADCKLRLAYVSPVLPEQTGIANYSSELLPALAEYYDIEVVVAQDRVDDPWINQHANVRDVNWLRANAGKIDRVLYHFGNSPFHRHMLTLVEEIPGTVVLHDFYISGLMHWRELHANEDYAWTKALYLAHGYGAVRERFVNTETATVNYPVNLNVLQYAQGLIVHSTYSQKLALQWYGKDFEVGWEVIPHLRSPRGQFDKVAARKQLGMDPDDFIVCSFGFLSPTKLNHRLLECWQKSALAGNAGCRLIFVGENCGGWYGAAMLQKVRESHRGKSVTITGFASPESYRLYLAAADVAIQIRTSSRGETSGAVLDCMNHALPIIVNANGSMAELDPEAVRLLPDEFTDAELVDALETLWREPEKRRALGEKARDVILNHHAPAQCARRYAQAIERFYDRAETATPALVRAILAEKSFVSNDAELRQLARTIDLSLPLLRPARRLFLDITATCQNDLKTGIERVARAILLAFLESPPPGYRVEPVYLSDAGSQWHYRHARCYTLGLLGCPQDALQDDRAEPEFGDALVTLDLSGSQLIAAVKAGLHRKFRDQGVGVYATVFDLLPVTMPEMFPPGAGENHQSWLDAIASFDGAICISKSVADDLSAWQAQSEPCMSHRRPFRIGWFHLGADVEHSAPSRGLPFSAGSVLTALGRRPSFLLVGTVEPRKGYRQILEAFTLLWQEGGDVNLVIVGQEGWRGLPDDWRRDIPQTVETMKNHPERDERLFWLSGISDEYLEKVYAASTCLIAASYGEGFGLPLIEAARHGLPISARDIPVFHEVAGASAFYFNGKTSPALADSLKTWLALHREGRHPTSTHLRWSTWKESADRIKLFALQDQCTFRQLLVDISELVQKDAKSGIQRVVRAILAQWLADPPKGYRVEPVYATVDQEYRYARRFLRRFPHETGEDETLQDEPVTYARGDIFFGLDFQPQVVPARKMFYQDLRRRGVKVYFAVYDLLCATLPHCFPSRSKDEFEMWLRVVAESDGAACISRSTADEFEGWLKKSGVAAPLKISFFHLGADVDHSLPSQGVPVEAEGFLNEINPRLSFLMVGTLEPRKAHALALEAFERLWASGLDVVLVIVGKPGWMVEALAKKIHLHPELGRRLFWLESISDEYLEKVYAASTCLLAASEGEGFGLPLIEAARHGLPILARDIPVFREVAGDHAFYFKGDTPEALAESILAWLTLYQVKQAPRSEDMHWLTWHESARCLLELILPDPREGRQDAAL